MSSEEYRQTVLFRFYCELGSKSSQSIICPVGHFCPVGSGAPTSCPNGTYTDALGNTGGNDCEPCDPGKYCNGTGSVSGNSNYKWRAD